MGGNFHLHGTEGVPSCLLDPWLLSKLPPPQPQQEKRVASSHVCPKLLAFWLDSSSQLPSNSKITQPTIRGAAWPLLALLSFYFPYSLSLLLSSSYSSLSSLSFPLLSSWPWLVSVSDSLFTFSLSPCLSTIKL